MEEPRYKVILVGRTLPGWDHAEVLEGLAGLFNSTVAVMEPVLRGRPTALKKEYSESRASELCREIRARGAQCEIEKVGSGETVGEAVDEPVGEVVDDTTGEEPETVHEDVRGAADRDTDEYEKALGLVMEFVQVNTDYYRSQFARFGSPWRPSFRLSWNWPAFFFFFFWALYRKMWGMAALYMIVGAAMTTLAASGPGTIFSLIWLIFWPCVANWLYYKKAIATVHQAMETPEMADHYLRRGGVSKGMVWVGVIVMTVLSIWTGNHLARQFVEQYGEDIAGLLSGSGTQTTRDGEVIRITRQSGSGLVESSFTLSYLATNLKLLIAARGDAGNNAAVNEFIEKLNRGSYTDGWGNEIRITQEVDRYVLFSAGPDQTYGTGDDILQLVDLR